jgi:hypothetical protein
MTNMTGPGAVQASRSADLAQEQPASGCADEAAVLVAMSYDGERVLVADGESVRFMDSVVLLRRARVSALALVEGEAWIIVEDGGAHTLHRFDTAGDPLEPELRLGRLGANLRLTSVDKRRQHET